jgi:protein TonB
MRILFVATVALSTTLCFAQTQPADTKIDCLLVGPDYPAESRAHNETGQSRVKAAVDEDGRIVTVTIVRSAGYAALDEAALLAMRKSTCKPLYRGGKRVPFTFVQPYDFFFTADQSAPKQ